MVKKIIFVLLLITTSFLYAQKVESVTAVKGVTTSGDTVYVEYVVNILDDLLITADGDTIKLLPYKDLYMFDMEVNDSRIFAIDSLGNVVAVKKVSAGDTLHTDLGLRIRNLDLYYGAGNRFRTSNSFIIDDSLFIGAVVTTDKINLNGSTGIGGTLTMRGGDIAMNEYQLLNATAIQSTFYGSDNSISNEELLGIDDGTTAQIPVGGGAGSAMVWTTATGTGAPVRAGSPTFTGTTTAPKVKATTGTKAGYADLKNQTTAPSTVGTDSSRIQTLDDGSNIHIAVTTDDNTTETTRYLASKQDVINGDVGTSLWFDGSNDIVTIGANSNLVFSTSPLSIVSKLITKGSSTVQFINHGATHAFSMRINTNNTLEVLEADVASVGASTKTISNNLWSTVGYTKTGTSGVYYINGINAGTVTDSRDYSVAVIGLGAKTTVDYALNGNMAANYFFNLALDPTDAQDFDILNGGAIPYKYIGASQTKVYDETWTGSADSWSVGTGIVYNSNNMLGTGTGGSIYTLRNGTTLGTTLGKAVRITCDITADNGANVNITPAAILRDAAYANALSVTSYSNNSYTSDGSIKTLVVEGVITKVVDKAYIQFDVSTNSASYLVDNFTITNIGCVAQYEPSGINSSTWVEPNGLTATISGAVPVNPMPQVYTTGNVLGATYGNGNVSYAELNYLSEVTSDIQAQLDALGGGTLNSDLTIDSSWSRVSMIYDTVGAVVYVGDFVYSPTDGDYELASASASTTFPCTGLICRSAGIDKPTYILQEGYIRLNSWDWTKTGGVGDLLYLSTTAGDATQTAPSGTDEYIQIIGRVVGPDVIYFNPSMNWVKHE